MMKAVSPKLLVLLGVAAVVAAFGALRLASSDDVLGDVGFDQFEEVSDAETDLTQDAIPPIDQPTPASRNPFERGDAVSGAGPTPEVAATTPTLRSDVDLATTPPATTPPAPTTVTTAPASSFNDTFLPDPALIDAEPEDIDSARAEARDDTSADG